MWFPEILILTGYVGRRYKDALLDKLLWLLILIDTEVFHLSYTSWKTYHAIKPGKSLLHHGQNQIEKIEMQIPFYLLSWLFLLFK